MIFDLASNTWIVNFAYDVDLENAAKRAEPVRSLLEVGRSVMAFKSFSYHQCLLMIQIKGHLMPQRCIGGVLNPDVEPLLSHH